MSGRAEPLCTRSTFSRPWVSLSSTFKSETSEEDILPKFPGRFKFHVSESARHKSDQEAKILLNMQFIQKLDNWPALHNKEKSDRLTVCRKAENALHIRMNKQTNPHTCTGLTQASYVVVKLLSPEKHT